MHENEPFQFITNRGKNFKQKLIALQHTYHESKFFSNATSKCEDPTQAHLLKSNDEEDDDDDFDFNFNQFKSNAKKRNEKQCLNDLVLKDLIPSRFELKIKLQENIFKVRIFYDEPFSGQLQNIAQCLNVKDEKSLILMHEESMLSFEESPKSLNLSESDVLDCFIMNTKEEEKKSEKKGRNRKRSSKSAKKAKKLRYSNSSLEEYSIEYIDVEQNVEVSSLLQQYQALADQAQRNQEATERKNELINKNSDSIEVDNENCMISNDVETDSTKNLITVKFKFEGKIIRIPFDYDDCFWLHMREVYKQFDIMSKGNLIMMHNDRVLSKDETPRLLNLTIIDIIDCFLKPTFKEEDNEKEKTKESETDLNSIQIKIRNNLNLKRNISEKIKIRKDEPLFNLMKKYAQLVNCSLEDMIFEFDGERLNGEETASDLDLEDDCQINVLIKK